MKTKLDHIYGNPSGGGDITALENKVNSLSQIAVKNNIANQVLPQQKIKTAPTDKQNILRLEDQQWKQLVATSTQLNANTVSSGWEFDFTPQSIYSFIIRFGISGTDLNINYTMYIHNPNYLNNGAVFEFATNKTNLTNNLKIKFWVESKKLYILCNQNIKPINVYIKKELK